MIRSLYTAATGMLVQRQKMDVAINNISNIETTGFKKDNLVSRSFADMLIARIGGMGPGAAVIGPLSTGAHIDALYTDYTQGSLEETKRALDVALQGDGFFSVATPAGVRYTRDGSFSVSSDGYLMTADGNPVLGTNGGYIYVGGGEFAIDAEGVVTAADGTVSGTLAIVSFADNASLRKTGNNLYAGTGAIAGKPAPTSVKQGYLEASNVDIAGAMVDMMMINRAYETSQRVVKMLDESLGKAVNEVGRV